MLMLSAGVQTWTTFANNHGEKQPRSSLVFVPDDFEDHVPLPLVFAFHGTGVNAEYFAQFTGLAEKGSQAKFVTVFPNGTGRTDKHLSWNAGNCCSDAFKQNIDDIAFVDQLIDEMLDTGQIDEDRVYCSGFSNGSLLTYQLACLRGHRFGAVAAVAGCRGSETPHGGQPLSVLHVHGTNDTYTPFEGGWGLHSISRVKFIPVWDTLKDWISANGCSHEPEKESIPDTAGDGTHITVHKFGPGRGGSEVILHQIHGGGHTWPGREHTVASLGKVSHNLDVNDLIWDFFSRHRRVTYQ